jgi:hypothetical protein
MHIILPNLTRKVVALNAQPATLNVVSGIELLNEPNTTYGGGPIAMEILQDYYMNAYVLRPVLRDG